MNKIKKKINYKTMKGRTVTPLTEKTTIEKTITDETPTVVAYRVGQLEKSIARFGEKLDGISAGFATHKDIQDAKYHAEREHEAIIQKINSKIDRTQESLTTNVENHNKRLTKLENIVSWAAYLIIGMVITAVVSVVLIDKADAIDSFNVRGAE